MQQFDLCKFNDYYLLWETAKISTKKKYKFQDKDLSSTCTPSHIQQH